MARTWYDLSTVPTYQLRLHPTYYRQGFFNVPREFDHLVRADEGPLQFTLRPEGTVLTGRVDRKANRNGTARIFAPGLKTWFQSHFQEGEIVDVTFQSERELVLARPRSH